MLGTGEATREAGGQTGRDPAQPDTEPPVCLTSFLEQESISRPWMQLTDTVINNMTDTIATGGQNETHRLPAKDRAHASCMSERVSAALRSRLPTRFPHGHLRLLMRRAHAADEATRMLTLHTALCGLSPSLYEGASVPYRDMRSIADGRGVCLQGAEAEGPGSGQCFSDSSRLQACRQGAWTCVF